MKPRAVLHTTVAILVLGFASVAGSQPDQKAPDAGNDKNAGRGQQQGQQKGQQGKQQGQQGRQQGQQARQQGQQQQRQPQGHAQAQPQQGHPQQPQAHTQQRTRPNAPPVVDRRTQVRTPVQSRTPMGQRMRNQAPAQRTPQARMTPPVNRIQPPSRRVVAAPLPSGTSWTGAQQRAVWPRYRAQSWNTQHRTWAQRGGYNGYRIPSSQFSLYFGRPHRFHLSHYRVRIVDSYPQFYANGFWFTILDPVPEYWNDDWYDSDDVTVIYGQDGYYLVNDRYPTTQISISVRL